MDGKNIEGNLSSASEKNRGVTSRRLVTSMRVLSEFVIGNAGNLDVVGRENLEKIPSGKKVVIATTHLSDLDVPIVALALGNDFDLAISHLSFHEKFFVDPSSYVGIKIAGEKNFVPLSSKKEGPTIRGAFRRQDFGPMLELLNQGKAIAVAAYSRTSEWKMPDRSGDAAVYLAQLADAQILPVAVNINSDRPTGLDGLKGINIRNRPRAAVFIGEPIYFEKVDLNSLQIILDKNSADRSPEETSQLSEIKGQMKDQSARVMHALAAMLPEAKRGKW